jgi:predicted nucleic acid-binding protein
VIVVSDSTTLIILANQQRFDLLHKLFAVVYVPSAVWDEIHIKGEVKLPAFIQCHALDESEDLTALGYLLDQGESEAIMLAKTLSLPLIIDEKKGRKIASQMGIRIVGLLGILYLNIKHEHLSQDEALAFLTAVRNDGFRISQALIDQMFLACGRVG